MGIVQGFLETGNALAQLPCGAVPGKAAGMGRNGLDAAVAGKGAFENR